MLRVWEPEPRERSAQNFEIRSWSAAVTVAIAATGASAMASTGVNLPRVFKMPLPFSFWTSAVRLIII